MLKYDARIKDVARLEIAEHIGRTLVEAHVADSQLSGALAGEFEMRRGYVIRIDACEFAT